MKCLKKRIVALLAAFILILGAASFFIITNGKRTVVEGLTENTRVYIDDIRCEDGRIHYTVVNHTFRRAMVGAAPYIQRYEDGEWVTVTLWDTSLFAVYDIKAFSDFARHVEVESPEKLTAGRYRLLFGEMPIPSNGDGATYIVGYFTVS